VVQITAGVDGERGVLSQPVRVVARGWFEGDHDRGVLDAVRDAVRDAVQTALRDGNRDDESLSKVAQRAAGRLLGQKYRRQPVLLTAIVVL
jgi:mRNA degradation ribonuclease J1/J2